MCSQEPPPFGYRIGQDQVDNEDRSGTTDLQGIICGGDKGLSLGEGRNEIARHGYCLCINLILPISSKASDGDYRNASMLTSSHSVHTRLDVALVVRPATISLPSLTTFILIPDIDEKRNRCGEMLVGGSRPVQQR